VRRAQASESVLSAVHLELMLMDGPLGPQELLRLLAGNHQAPQGRTSVVVLRKAFPGPSLEGLRLEGKIHPRQVVGASPSQEGDPFQAGVPCLGEDQAGPETLEEDPFQAAEVRTETEGLLEWSMARQAQVQRLLQRFRTRYRSEIQRLIRSRIWGTQGLQDRSASRIDCRIGLPSQGLRDKPGTFETFCWPGAWR